MTDEEEESPEFQNCDCALKSNIDFNATESNDLQTMNVLYPHPKLVLNNYFNIVAQELDNIEYQIKPQYVCHSNPKQANQFHWICSYNIKWPEAVEFQKSGKTKQEASTRAALSALIYLYKAKKITKHGMPIIYDIDAVKRITGENHCTLRLNDLEREYLSLISYTYAYNLKPLLNEEELTSSYLFDDHNNNLLQCSEDAISEDRWQYQRLQSKYLKLYNAKESVKLPVQDHKEEFMKLLDSNRIIIVHGQPGCGKSTRIPQYVLEHFVTTTQMTNARIVVTQPRRIAAISLAERVAQERNEGVGQIVGYHVRLKTEFNPRTGKILYCTTGILLRKIQTSPDLNDCTHIILDEAHERDVNTDLLMNLIRYAMKKNPNLKFIVMSATIDIGLFQKYFDNPPVLNIPGFTHNVKVNFLEDIKLDLSHTAELWKNSETILNYQDIVNVIAWIHATKPEGAILVFLPGWEEILRVKQLLMKSIKQKSCVIVSIHSKLLHEEQKQIFEKPPVGVRKIILATNIAETSVTVGDVVYVVDSGIHKEARFDPERGIRSIDNYRISQSNMKQRKGRAGRVTAGESFHIYPLCAYNEMAKHSLPEILRMSLTKIVLDSKVYTQNMDAQEFFSYLPSPPSAESVIAAVNELKKRGMLDGNENLTPLGRIIADFQLPPNLAKAMVFSLIYKCVVPIVDIATIFSYESDMFKKTLTDKEEIRCVKSRLSNESDHMAMMIIFEQWANMINKNDFVNAAELCSKNGLLPQKLTALKQLKDLHYEYINKYVNAPLHSNQYSSIKELIKGVLLSGVNTVLFQRNWDFAKGRLTLQKALLTSDFHRANIASESVNYKKETYSSPLLLYINEMQSEMRRTTIIRETSVIKPLTYLLFNNNDLIIKELSKSDKTDVTDPVIIKVDGTKLKFLCNREEAIYIKNCKNTLRKMENYFLYQFIKEKALDKDVLEHWDTLLNLLTKVLQERS